jgi:hypothetical protein
MAQLKPKKQEARRAPCGLWAAVGSLWAMGYGRQGQLQKARGNTGCRVTGRGFLSDDTEFNKNQWALDVEHLDASKGADKQAWPAEVRADNGSSADSATEVPAATPSDGSREQRQAPALCTSASACTTTWSMPALEWHRTSGF